MGSGPRRDDGERFMLSPGLAARVRNEVADVAASTFAKRIDFAPPDAAETARAAVETFFSLYRERAVRGNKGGFQFNDSLWLYVVARSLAPRLIVESGVFQGHSTWLLRQACPDATIHSFDVDLSNIVYRDGGGTLSQCDWTDAPLRADDPAQSLAFFDDHVNQAKRVREAYDRGFRVLLFDDNLPAWNLYATGIPPVPTIAMLLDSDLVPGREIRWSRNGKELIYVYREEDTFGARELIDRCVPLPDISGITRYNRGSGLTLVKLVD